MKNYKIVLLLTCFFLAFSQAICATTYRFYQGGFENGGYVYWFVFGRGFERGRQAEICR